MKDDWIEILRSKNYEAWLLNLSIATPGQEPMEGFGRLVWEDDRLNVEAFAQNIDVTTAFQTRFQPGQFIRPDQYSILKAETRDGWDVEIGHIHDMPNINLSRGRAEWRFTTPILKLGQDTRVDVKCLRALIGPVEKIFFPRYSVSRDDNPHFGGGITRRDWISFEPSFGSVVLRRFDSDEVAINIEGDLTQDGLVEALESVQLAVSFVEGRNVKLIGYEIISENQRCRWITKDVRMTNSRFSPPFGNTGSPKVDYEQALTLASSFFHTQVGKLFSNRLRMCWASVDSPGTQRTLAVCTAVEKLVKESKNKLHVPKVAEEEAVKKEIKQLLATKNDVVSERFVRRITSFLGLMNSIDVRFILNQWSQTKFLGIDQKDFEAWKTLRDPASHGELLFIYGDENFEERTKTFESLFRVENLLNKLVLHEMDYNGLYFDQVAYQFRPLKGS